jgi:hypothetical protein
LEKYGLAVRAALKNILGDSGARAILFYVGEPDPHTFETKLRSILGNGAPVVIPELKKRIDVGSASAKHHWLGGNGWVPRDDTKHLRKSCFLIPSE